MMIKNVKHIKSKAILPKLPIHTIEEMTQDDLENLLHANNFPKTTEAINYDCAENPDSVMTFCISSNEWKKITHWQKCHKCTLSQEHGVDHYVGAAGGRFTYIITPTNIGTIYTCKCSCGEEITVSDI